MSKEFKLTKKNKKSRVYENDEFIVKVKDTNGGYYIKMAIRRIHIMIVKRKMMNRYGLEMPLI